MRVMNGIDATRRIRDADGPPVLILTTFDDDETLWAAIDAGAAGFVLKDAPAADLIRAVRTVASGAAWLDPQVTPRVLAIYRTTVLPQAREQERAAQLTDREHDVLRLIAEGSTNAEIADRAARQRRHGEEPRRVDLHQARRARPGRGDRVRLPARHRVTPRSELTTGPSSDDTGGGRPYRRRHDCAVGDPATHQAVRRPRRRRRRRPHRHEGEIFGILGLNGAGKTTLVECAQGLRHPDGGTVRLLGRDPARDRSALASRVGSQLQDSNLPERMRVSEAVALFADRRMSPDAVAEWGLDRLWGKSFGSLSGASGSACSSPWRSLNEPEIVFLDELTQGLDPSARRVVWDLVKLIRARGTTVVLVTHFIDEAEVLCDRVVVMRDGRFVAHGSPAELVEQYGPGVGVSFTDAARRRRRAPFDLRRALGRSLRRPGRAARRPPDAGPRRRPPRRGQPGSRRPRCRWTSTSTNRPSRTPSST